MRLALAGLLCSTLAGGAIPQQWSASSALSVITEAPRPLVVFVHGRGQLGLDTAMLRREWQRELDTALSSVGLPALHDEDVRLAWYADVLDPEVENECATRPSGIEELGVGDLTRMLFASLTSSLPVNEGRGARGLFGELLYFMDGSMRCAAGRRLERVVNAALAAKRPIVIIAYSMGAVVAYDYLKSTNVKGDIRLITAGSPLGAREFRELLFGVGASTPLLPEGVVSWVNVYDPDDPFAAPIGADRMVDRRTELPYAGSAHFHGRYLRDPAMGRALGQALCATTSHAISASCSRL